MWREEQALRESNPGQSSAPQRTRAPLGLRHEAIDSCQCRAALVNIVVLLELANVAVADTET